MDEGDDALDDRGRNLPVCEPQNSPTGQRGFEILFRIGGEARCSIVTAAAGKEDPAFDLDKSASFDVGEVGTPASFRMKTTLMHQLRPAEQSPILQKLSFEPRWRSGVAMAQELHAPALLSK